MYQLIFSNYQFHVQYYLLGEYYGTFIRKILPNLPKLLQGTNALTVIYFHSMFFCLTKQTCKWCQKSIDSMQNKCCSLFAGWVLAEGLWGTASCDQAGGRRCTDTGTAGSTLDKHKVGTLSLPPSKSGHTICKTIPDKIGGGGGGLSMY